jgi:hypothetical protein
MGQGVVALTTSLQQRGVYCGHLEQPYVASPAARETGIADVARLALLSF